MTDLDCPHFRIEHDTVLCPEHGVPHGVWECDDCEEEFIPVSMADEQIDRLQNAMVELIMKNQQQRGYVLAAATLWIGTVLGAVLL